MKLIFKTTKAGTKVKCPECGNWIKVGISEVKTGMSFVCEKCNKRWGVHAIP